MFTYVSELVKSRFLLKLSTSCNIHLLYNYVYMQVNSNGVVSFGNRGFIDYRARSFPFQSPPLIAPFWDDFNPRRGGMIYYRETNDTDQLELFYN